MAAAPSLIFEAFPAVTEPSFLKAGLSPAHAKAELDCRGEQQTVVQMAVHCTRQRTLELIHQTHVANFFILGDLRSVHAHVV